MPSPRSLAIRNYLIAASLVIGLATAIAGSYLSLDRRSRANTLAVEQLARGQERIEAKLDRVLVAVGDLAVRVARLEERVGALEKQVGKLLNDFNDEF